MSAKPTLRASAGGGVQSALDGVVLAHESAGVAGGAWITFVPGIGNDRTFWAPIASQFAAQYRTLLFDPWGHGVSADPPHAGGFDALAADVVRLWDRVGVESSFVVGLGFGGSTALSLAISHPKRVRGVAAFCCRARLPDDRRAFWRDRSSKAAEIGMSAMADITVDRWLSAAFRADHRDTDSRLRAAMARVSFAGYRAYVDAFVEMDIEGALGSIRCPVQLGAAELDHGGGPPDAMRALAGEIAGAQLTIIPGVGHICVAEAPGHVERIIRRLLPPPVRASAGETS